MQLCLIPVLSPFSCELWKKMIVSSVQPLKKKVSVSKNKKKSWRKHCDVSEVEDHLEEKRKEEILGGPVAEKTDDQIFFHDKTEIPKKALKRKYPTGKPLKFFKILENDSKVEPPLIPPPARRTALEAGRSKRIATECNANADVARRDKNVLRRYNSEMVTGTYDIWDPDDAPAGEKIEAEIEDEQINEYYKEVTKRKRFKLPKVRLPKAVLVSAVDVPHRGASYNPVYDDYVQLLDMASRVEEKEARERKKLQKKAIPAVNAESLAESFLQEMSQGLQVEGDDGGESDCDCSAPLSINPPVRAEDRKTKQKRRRASEHKKRISAIRVKKLQDYRERQAFKIPRWKGEILRDEARFAARKAERAKKRAAKVLRPRRTGKEKYKSPKIDVLTSDDLVGSLYQLKARGNLALERFKSFERRSIIEGKGPGRQSKRTKRKSYVKRDFRLSET